MVNNSNLLCIDIGNTNIVLGVYHRDDLIAHWRIATDYQRMPDEYAALLIQLLSLNDIAPNSFKGVAICSVVPPLTSVFAELCQKYFGHIPLVVRGDVFTGVDNCYENPKDVGADRLVDAAAAYQLYGGPACIVDFGTATTFDALTADGEYVGGAIAPGISISAEALFARTSKLPRIDLSAPAHVIGRNTEESMQSGILYGYIGLVEGVVARFCAELGADTKVIATGGLAEMIAEKTEVLQIVDPWLTLKGLRIIYGINMG